MIKGTTVIFNEEYIGELERHRDNAKKKFEVEDVPEFKQKAQKYLDACEKRLEWATEFRDTVDHFVHLDVPNITGVVTVGGYELPAKHLQVLN